MGIPKFVALRLDRDFSIPPSRREEKCFKNISSVDIVLEKQ